MSTTTFDAYIHVRQALEHVRPLLSPATYKEAESRNMAGTFVKAHPHMMEHMKLLRNAIEKEDAFRFRRTMRNWYMNMAPWDRPTECQAWLPDFLGDAKFFGEDEIIHTGYQFPGSAPKKRRVPCEPLDPPPLIKRMKPNTSPSTSRLRGSSGLKQSPPSPAPPGQSPSTVPHDQSSSTLQSPLPGPKRLTRLPRTNSTAPPPLKLSNLRFPVFKGKLPPRKRKHVEPKREEGSRRDDKDEDEFSDCNHRCA